MRLKPEAMAEAMRSMEKTAERHAAIQAAFESAARDFSVGLSPPDFYTKKNSQKSWKSATLEAIYRSNSPT
jgi:hypothetical protein